MDVALATTAGLPVTDQDEGPLLAALERQGVQAGLAVWDDASFAWDEVQLVVIRSTWDYWDRRDEFVHWAERVEQVTELWNPAAVIRWNTHKSYLIELEERGAPVVPTAWLGQGDRVSLERLLRERQWKRAVIKPAVGAAADGLHVVEPHAVDLAQHHLDALLRRGDAMIQPLLASVHEEGEWSVVLIDGLHSHTVLKRAAPGDVRTQVDFGATYEPVTPDRELVDLAEWVVGSTGHELLYARVDVLRDRDGTPQLSELEVTEPSLYLSWVPEAADRFAAAIRRRL